MLEDSKPTPENASIRGIAIDHLGVLVSALRQFEMTHAGGEAPMALAKVRLSCDRPINHGADAIFPPTDRPERPAISLGNSAGCEPRHAANSANECFAERPIQRMTVKLPSSFPYFD